jgi:hypothetical protein
MGENVGFINWGDTPSPGQVTVGDTFLSGKIWGENIGWINLGNGNGPYANTNDRNFGVNRNATFNNLSGYAWGENIGWINFSGGAFAAPRNVARIEGGRFRGFVWSENIGWINLDDHDVFVGLVCLGDIADSNGTLGNNDGVVDFGDLLALFGLAGPCPGGVPGCTGDIADSNGTLGNSDGVVDFGDLLALFGLAGPCF